MKMGTLRTSVKHKDSKSLNRRAQHNMNGQNPDELNLSETQIGLQEGHFDAKLSEDST